MRSRRRGGPPAEPVRLSDIEVRALRAASGGEEPTRRATPARISRRSTRGRETGREVADTGLGIQESPLIFDDGLILRVSAIEKQERRRRYNVFVNGEFAMALEPEVLAGSGLKLDEPVTAERLRELSVEDLRKRAL